MLQMWPHKTLNPLCQARDGTCVPVLPNATHPVAPQGTSPFTFLCLATKNVKLPSWFPSYFCWKVLVWREGRKGCGERILILRASCVAASSNERSRGSSLLSGQPLPSNRSAQEKDRWHKLWWTALLLPQKH